MKPIRYLVFLMIMVPFFFAFCIQVFATPPCPNGGTWNPSLNRCELNPPSWSCPYSGSTYSSQSTCNNNCYDQGNCTPVNKKCYRDVYNASQCNTYNGPGTCQTTNLPYEWLPIAYRCINGGDCSAGSQCAGNSIPSGASVIGLYQHGCYKVYHDPCVGIIPTGNECWSNIREYYSYTEYQCSQNGNGYSTWSDCNTVCRNYYTCEGVCPEGYIYQDGECVAYDVDSDGDSLSDLWERYYFGNLNQSAGGDYDNDQLTNLQEYQLGFNPTIQDIDNDNDRMLDGWEAQNGLNPLLNDAMDDLDGDGFSNYIEYRLQTNPNNPNDKPPRGIFYEYDALGRIKKIIDTTGE